LISLIYNFPLVSYSNFGIRILEFGLFLIRNQKSEFRNITFNPITP
jgi:hypothetical protein